LVGRHTPELYTVLPVIKLSLNELILTIALSDCYSCKIVHLVEFLIHLIHVLLYSQMSFRVSISFISHNFHLGLSNSIKCLVLFQLGRVLINEFLFTPTFLDCLFSFFFKNFCGINHLLFKLKVFCIHLCNSIL
jgi:hypothetical protein